MRFKDLLTAGGESYNRQSNSDSSGERKNATDSSSGDLESGEGRLFKNISSGEESLLRGTVGDHEVFRPVPVLPLQSYYSSRGSEPLQLPHYAPLGSDATPPSEANLPPVYTPESPITPTGSEPWTELNISNERGRNNRNARPADYSSLKFQDVGHEIDV